MKHLPLTKQRLLKSTKHVSTFYSWMAWFDGVALRDLAITQEFCARRCPASSVRKTGGAYRDRTDDPLLAKQVLSQLS